jgi:hypothetical protein
MPAPTHARFRQRNRRGLASRGWSGSCLDGGGCKACVRIAPRFEWRLDVCAGRRVAGGCCGVCFGGDCRVCLSLSKSLFSQAASLRLVYPNFLQCQSSFCLRITVGPYAGLCRFPIRPHAKRNCGRNLACAALRSPSDASASAKESVKWQGCWSAMHQDVYQGPHQWQFVRP